MNDIKIVKINNISSKRSYKEGICILGSVWNTVEVDIKLNPIDIKAHFPLRYRDFYKNDIDIFAINFLITDTNMMNKYYHNIYSLEDEMSTLLNKSDKHMRLDNFEIIKIDMLNYKVKCDINFKSTRSGFNLRRHMSKSDSLMLSVYCQVYFPATNNIISMCTSVSIEPYNKRISLDNRTGDFFELPVSYYRIGDYSYIPSILHDNIKLNIIGTTTCNIGDLIIIRCSCGYIPSKYYYGDIQTYVYSIVSPETFTLMIPPSGKRYVIIFVENPADRHKMIAIGYFYHKNSSSMV